MMTRRVVSLLLLMLTQFSRIAVVKGFLPAVTTFRTPLGLAPRRTGGGDGDQTIQRHHQWRCFSFLEERDGSNNSFDDGGGGKSVQDSDPMMENVYQEWTLDQDKLLWANRQLTVPDLASLLGRGLRGVESRLTKLKDVNTPAYQRLFADGGAIEEGEESDGEKKKLVPAAEVLRRIKWDVALPTEEFSILYYDRVDDSVVESPVSAPNDSIAGNQELLADALPEHRIMAIKYRDRVVWDHENRIDRVFSNEGIEKVMSSYEEWSAKRKAAQEWNRQRQREVSERIQQILGYDRFSEFKALSSSLQSNVNPRVSMKLEVEKYVQSTLDLFRQVREDPSDSLMPSLIPMGDYETIDCLSEIVSLLPNATLRPMILAELSLCMQRADGKTINVTCNKELPEIREDDITETFVRGSGAGGQKINKTSNRVVLVHEPTQLRVECQETRSLQQNRKIARKRLRLKLDEYLHGSQSRESVKAQKASAKKSRAKARSRARQRRKREAKETAENS